MKHLLRYLPAVHELQADKRFSQLVTENSLSDRRATEIIQTVIQKIREQILAASWQGSEPGTAKFIDEVFLVINTTVAEEFEYTLKRVINATGTVIHTNIGRSRLSKTAIDHLIEISGNYSNLEYKLLEGKRGSRHDHVEKLVRRLTGAEAAMVVNNNAAAVYLILRALAEDKEVIVSRGQLVEIGGSFRISSIMEESGAKLVEVGTTNKTHLFDYQDALSDETAMILKVHTSNFKTIGFTDSVGTESLAQLAHGQDNVIFYEDLGSGVLFDFEKHGIGDEPVISQVIESGADLVSFSGDKLLGGPQAGIIAGKKSLIDRLKKHQLARVLRVDKMTLAALEGTLIDYAKGGEALKKIPTFRDLLATKEELLTRAESLADQIKASCPNFSLDIISGVSQVGGGTMPEVEVETAILSLKHASFSAEQVSKLLRTENDPAIVVRIANEQVLIDLRTITEEESELIVAALKRL